MIFALGFVALFTIGGFKNQLALPCLWRLKINICCKLLTIILLGFYKLIGFYRLLDFYKLPEKMYSFEQSAGNKRIKENNLEGTSETTRNHFTILKKKYSP